MANRGRSAITSAAISTAVATARIIAAVVAAANGQHEAHIFPRSPILVT
jgi:hypothetical protein